jgi:hypothetical protein
MPFLVEQDVTFDPVYIDANRVVFDSDGITDTSTISVQAWSSSFLGRWFILCLSQLSVFVFARNCHTALILLLNSYAYWCILLMWGYWVLTQVVGGPTRVISALPCLASELDGQDFRLIPPEGGLYGKLSC